MVDGVFVRERHVTDVLGFVKPRRATRPGEPASETVTVRMSYLTSNPQTKARAVANIQTALNRVTGGVFNRGRLDRETRSTFGAYSRERGLVENRGDLTYDALNVLGIDAGGLDIEP